mgnify:FL=1
MSVFLEENSKINLSAYRTEEACWIGNILDSLAFLELSFVSPPFPRLPSEAWAKEGTGEGLGVRALDLGTGGGFPLLPLAIALPEYQFTGIDATQKKIAAVNRIIERQNITNARALPGRAEDLGRDPLHREKYDIVLSRGLAKLSTLLEYCAPFAKTGGKIVLWKSLNILEELAESAPAEKELRCRLLLQHRYALPGDFGERQLLVFEKGAPIPKKYPRGVGIPSKNPLL